MILLPSARSFVNTLLAEVSVKLHLLPIVKPKYAKIKVIKNTIISLCIKVAFGISSVYVPLFAFKTSDILNPIVAS